MYSHICLWLALLILIVSPVLCLEVGYVFTEDGGFELSNATLSQINPFYEVNFTTSGKDDLIVSNYKKRVNELQENLKERVELDKMRMDAISMIFDSPGTRTVNQTCLIYNNLSKNWRTFGDPSGHDYYQYASETLRGSIGAGDCDDFAILMAALVGSIGGTTRIVLAKGPGKGHAYCEVFLGKNDSQNRDVGRIKNWLIHKYNLGEVHGHIDMETGDFWLSLNWDEESRNVTHPGYNLPHAVEHILVYIDTANKQPLNPSPMALFKHPDKATAGEEVVFDASESEEVDRIKEYCWSFGNEIAVSNTAIINHTFDKGGSYIITLRVVDEMGAESMGSKIININSPPIAKFKFFPENPQVGSIVTFDASLSMDPEGETLSYLWEFDNEDSSRRSVYRQVYQNDGWYWVNLTVTDEKGAKGFKSYHLKVNKPPEANFTYYPNEPNPLQEIAFNGESSTDHDGNITSYLWDFNDRTPLTEGQKVNHVYSEGGTYTVLLTVTDDDGAIGSCSSNIIVNHPPLARFSYEHRSSSEIIFDASNSSDPDGDKIVSYNWDFGDLTAPQNTPRQQIRHIYSEVSDFNVTLIVEDEKGLTGSFHDRLNSSTLPPIPVFEKWINVSEKFVPSNYGGDIGDIKANFDFKGISHSEPSCIEINYSAIRSEGAGWATISWVYPASNNGGEPGYNDEFIKAKKLTFWAKGKNGGEKAEFKMGGIGGEYSDSVKPAATTGVVTLSNQWKQYSIDLASRNLSHVIRGFCWVAEANLNSGGYTIYIDDIKYES